MTRIPEDATFVLRPNKGKLGTYFGCSLLVIAALPSCVALSVVIVTGSDPTSIIFLMLPFAPIALMFAGVVAWRGLAAVRGGPTLAADATGLWVQARKLPVRAQHLRWEELAWVAVRRSGVDRSVCVMPRAEILVPGQDRRERKQMRYEMRTYGAPYTASLTWGDRPEAEVMATLAQLAAGRCQVVTG